MTPAHRGRGRATGGVAGSLSVAMADPMQYGMPYRRALQAVDRVVLAPASGWVGYEALHLRLGARVRGRTPGDTLAIARVLAARGELEADGARTAFRTES